MSRKGKTRRKLRRERKATVGPMLDRAREEAAAAGPAAIAFAYGIDTDATDHEIAQGYAKAIAHDERTVRNAAEAGALEGFTLYRRRDNA